MTFWEKILWGVVVVYFAIAAIGNIYGVPRGTDCGDVVAERVGE